jgi:hypothetical protein
VIGIDEFADDLSGFRPKSGTPAAAALHNTVGRDLVCRQIEITGPVRGEAGAR